MSKRDGFLELFSSNQLLLETISSGQLFALGRLGSVEAQLVEVIHQQSEFTPQQRKLAWINAGIAYPTNSELKRFSSEYCQSLGEMDLMAQWPTPNIMNQDKLISQYGGAVTNLVPLRILDPVQLFVSGVSEVQLWTQALKGKNVLVISQFANTISKQFSKRRDLHQVEILPDFNLQTISPPSTNGATFLKGNYSRNLRKFRNQIENEVNDQKVEIALVSAGAYGLPINAFLKSLGISSIYMGGSLQLLFGIMGNRWREIESIHSVVTPNWIMAPKENRPFGYRLIENGSYW